MAAAAFLQSKLELEQGKPQTSLDLLGNLHSVALALMEFDHHLGDVSPTARAAELFQYSLDNFGEDPAIRERLSAALRALGKLNKSAEELFRVIKTLEEEGTVDDEILCMLYLDLGFLIDDIMPLPGSGYELETVTNYDEKDAPKLTFQHEEITETFNDGEITYQLETRTISLSSFDCYRTAIRLDPTSGLAHKKLADALAIIGNEGANAEFAIAAKYLPEDICCATHLHFASMQNDNQVASRQAIPLQKDMRLGTTLDDICVDFNQLTTSLTSMASKFETNGVLVFPEALTLDDVNVLSDKLEEIISSITDGNSGCTVSDFSDETKASKRRIHMALPLVNDEKYTQTISNLLGRLHPLMSLILQCNSTDDDIPLIGSGFMQTSPNAIGQDLHKDVHHLDRHEAFDEEMPESWNCNLNGYPRCISIQVQLTDTTLGGKMGSLEVLPGSHRPDTGISPSLIAHAVRDPNDGESGVIPVNVVPGTITIYSSRLWHRGGANESKIDRRFCFFTAAENQQSAPPGLIHTMQTKDVGKWRICSSGCLEKG
jgi:ectoine hydroxylase-related dioxygenase (phytanoyl-CoA dioxygenase family)